MSKSFVIDCLPESARHYRHEWAIVAVDVIRATTTAITAAATGRRCFPVPTIQAALALAPELDNAVLAGESGGAIPAGFEIDNSPAHLASRPDTYRPLILVSSSGTKVIHEALGCAATYISCFRSYSTLPGFLCERHPRVAIIGAGTKGEFREEDQICCAWIAAGLLKYGYEPENPQTVTILDRWRHASAAACICSHSVDFLKRTGRFADLDFILGHVDDLQDVFAVLGGEVVAISPTQVGSLKLTA